jgi:nitroreductase
MSLPNPRTGFGRARAAKLIEKVEEYQSLFGEDELVAVARDTLKTYEEWNHQRGCHFPEVTNHLNHWQHQGSNTSAQKVGGTQTFTKTEQQNAVDIDFEGFLKSRHSIRHFSTEPVDPQLIAQAVAMAQTSPSVCNRQSSRVHVLTEHEHKKQALSFQNGNRGFGDTASHVLIVTSDMRDFVNVGERFQGWIDGGMFSMTLLLALHSLGLGACSLNWSAPARRDREMRHALGIPDNELVIMMIAVGNFPEELSVALSARRPLDEILDTFQ